MTRPPIDPALGLDLVATRTLHRRPYNVSVVIPAHNERETVAHVVTEAQRGLGQLGVEGEVIVSASGCTDDTADVAKASGARVVLAPIGKGAAISAAVPETSGDVVCLVDGDVRYLGDAPLVTILVEPILRGIADACVSDLYWRPLYPQLWQCGFFAPLAGAVFPELLSKAGSTAWTGQRAAKRELWPTTLPDGFTVDLALLLRWNRTAVRMRPVLTDDWVNPQRPKPDLMEQELALITDTAIEQGRLSPDARPAVAEWFEAAHRLMAAYRPDQDDPQEFERRLLDSSIRELRRQLHRHGD